MIKNKEDIEFYILQRQKGRKGYMAGVDNMWIQSESKKKRRQISKERLIEKEKKRKEEIKTVKYVFSSSSSSDGSKEDFEIPSTSKCSENTTGKREILTSDVSLALDRTNISDRQACFVLSATAAALDCDIDKLSLSRSTIRRRRISTREKIANSIKESFDPCCPLIVHWDGKMLCDFISDEKVNRLAVVVSGGGSSKLLAVTKLSSETGINIATSVLETLDNWGIKDRIQGMCFDTPVVNTGHKQGAAMIIEQNIGRSLLHIACRHHIHELILTHVFDKCFPSSGSGPNIAIFRRLKNQWGSIDKEKYEKCKHEAWMDNIVIICKNHLAEAQIRDDYKELLEITLIYLGHVPPSGIKFNKPGAFHRARWMAKLIYAIKITLYSTQFEMMDRKSL